LPLSTQTCTFGITPTAFKKARKSFAAKVTRMSRKQAVKKAIHYDTWEVLVGSPEKGEQPE